MVRNVPPSVRLATWVGLVLLVGCGKSTPDTDESASSPRPAAATSAVAAGESAPNIDTANDTVAQFLDAIRRGGDTGGAHSLLTQTAASVLESLGRTVQPIGSPDATFDVTRSEAVEEHPNMALVHSTWSEPNGDGTAESYEVVWAVQWERQAWKISGLAMGLDAEQPPMIVDFEDHAQMAALFRGEAEAEVAAEATTGETQRTAEAGQSEPSAGTF